MSTYNYVTNSVTNTEESASYATHGLLQVLKEITVGTSKGFFCRSYGKKDVNGSYSKNAVTYKYIVSSTLLTDVVVDPKPYLSSDTPVMVVFTVLPYRAFEGYTTTPTISSSDFSTWSTAEVNNPILVKFNTTSSKLYTHGYAGNSLVTMFPSGVVINTIVNKVSTV